MSIRSSQLEAAILQSLLPSLEAEGFQTFLYPARLLLPFFMQRYRPDAIALKASKKIAIEVMSVKDQGETKLRHMREMFLPHPEWELRIVYAPPRSAKQSIPISSKKSHFAALDRLVTMFEEFGGVPALLTAWSVFEGSARFINPDAADRPQAPAGLVEVLASEGHITPEEADDLRRLARVRNEAAHGWLSIALSKDELEWFVGLIRTLLQASEPGARERPDA